MKIVAPEISRQCEDSEDAVRIRRLPEPFHFYRLSFNSDHLHFGFWPDNSVNLSLEEAQETMFQRLLEHFPDPPARVLDVGCGLGRSAFLLKQKGYQVVAIAPAAEMIAYASEKYGGDHIEFHVAGFPDGEDTGFAAATYDVILFQESLQYLRALPLVFEKCRALLHPKGRLIIGDEICYDPSIKTETAVHRSEDVVTALLENGFRITDHKKIGNNVLPTCDQVIRQFTEKFDQIVGAVCTEDAAERLGFFLKGWKAQKDWYAEQKMGYDIIVAKKDRVSIRTYQDGDEIKILALFNHAFKTGRTAEHWYWKYRDNPFGAFHIAEAVSENGRLAAQYCGYPVPFYFPEENERMVFHIGDTMTDPDFRGSGLGKTSILSRTTLYFYNRFCRESVPFNYGFNTGNIRKFGERFLQYEYTSTIPYYILDLRKTEPPYPGSLKKILSGFSVRKVSRFTEEYDRFFENVCKDYGMLVKRNALYLNWRYLDCPDGVHQVFAVRKFGKLVGWSVFSVKDRLLMWGDALFDRKRTEAVSFMFVYLLGNVYPNVEKIEGWFSPVPSWWTTVLRSMGFRVEDEPNRLAPTFKIFDRKFSTDFFKRHFYYTMGDSDLF